VSSQSAELEALEARLRETEERLREKQSQKSSPAPRATGDLNPPHRRQPLGDTFAAHESEHIQQPSVSSPLAAQPPPSGAVSSSTMSFWRQAAQDGSSERSRNARDVPAEQLSGQQGSRYTQ